MILRLASAFLAGLLLTAAQIAQAGLDFVTAGRPAILYDAPSLAAKKVAAVAAGYPFEVLVRIEGWLKVRDNAGHLLWIEASAAQGKPGVMVTADSASIMEKPQTDAPTRYRVSKGVLLEVAGNSGTPGWLKVRHPQGGEGYLRVQDIWGQ